MFSVQGQIVTIKEVITGIHVYRMGTGEVLEPTQASRPHYQQFDLRNMRYGRHYQHYRELHIQAILSKDNRPVSETTLQDGWVRDPEGKHRLWIPAKWRKPGPGSSWFLNITTLRLECGDRTVIIML